MGKGSGSKFLLLGLAFFIMWIFKYVTAADEAKSEGPKLNITENYIDVPVNSTVYIQCTGQRQLSWKYREPQGGSKKFQEMKTVPETSESDGVFKSIAQLFLKSYKETGEYICYYNDSSASASVYIFVNDDSHLLLPLNHYLYTFHEGTRAVIPCLPTNSKANVTLWKKKSQGDEMVALSSGMEYNTMEGFVLMYPTVSFKGYFHCLADLQSMSENSTFHIEVLQQTQSIPEVYINDKDAKYVLLHSNFTLICSIRVLRTTLMDPVRWTFPVKDDKRIIYGKERIKKVAIFKTMFYPLTILNAQKTDEGVYQCNATDHSSRENYHQVEIKIYENPQDPIVNFTKGLESIIKSRGEEVDLIAKYTVFPLTTDIRPLWIKDNAQLSPAGNKYKIRSSNSEYRLSISNLTRLDMGFYTVATHTSGGDFNKSFHLRVKDTPAIKIQNVTACCFVPGQSYQIQCESKGFPAPSLSWNWKHIHDCTNPSCDQNKEWKNVDDLNYVNNHTQWFMNFDEENVWSLLNVTAIISGFYKCVSQNEMGIAEEVIPFIVSDVKNGFDIEIDDPCPLERNPFSMTCRASSDLYSNLSWTWTSHFINESDSSDQPIPDELLIRSNTSYSISLQMNMESVYLNNSGIYSCFANRKFGDTLERKIAHINVTKIHEPKFVNEDWDRRLIAAANSILKLDCEVDGTPLPKVTWYRNRDLLTSNFTGGKFEEGFRVLIISRLVDEDSGDYACVAENVAGAIIRNWSLSVVSSGVSGHVTQGISEPIHLGVLVAAGICVATILILLILFARWFYKRKHTLMKLQGFNHQLFQEGHFGIYDPNMPIDEQVDLLPYDNRWEFPKDNLKFGRTLGQGAFGRVVKAEAFGLHDYEKSTTVAVKMLKERADINQQRALSAELKILIHLGHHVNIVNLMGAVTKNIEKGELLVMVEYCKYGNLRNYLLRHRDKFVNETDLYSRSPIPLSESPPLDSSVTCFTEVRFDTFMSSSGSGSTVFAVDNPNYRQRVQSIVSSDPKGSCSSHVLGRSMSTSSSSDSRYYCRVDSQEHVITTSDLLCFSFQSACGMDYLASRKLIHRDLAARNVLLTEDKVVKICDFGLAKDCYKYENYVKKGDGPLPIKWMAVESIRDHVFTTKSDVWSFGILLWEFFTLGSNPYPGIEIDEEFYKRLNAGFRMERPDYCPQDVYHIMQDCWLSNPDDRPDFSQIADTLGGFMESGVKQHYIDLNAPYLEMNNKMLTHNYLNMQSDECQITPTNLYMNSETSNSFLYDNLPPISRPVLNPSVRDDGLEDIPMIDLDITEERQKERNFKKQEFFAHQSDYLQMGESCSVR